MQTVAKLTEKVALLEAKISELTNVSLATSAPVSNDVLKRVKDIEEKLEERTNRQLRKTLVFRGVAERDNEKSWADTRKVLANKIAGLVNSTSDEASSLIDRCHRGGKKNATKPRPIYVDMKYWEDCESIVWSARKKKTVLVDYKYGPLTNKRRNLSLLRWRWKQ